MNIEPHMWKYHALSLDLNWLKIDWGSNTNLSKEQSNGRLMGGNDFDKKNHNNFSFL